jgi:NADH-quinone oxidoreductase subunit N
MNEFFQSKIFEINAEHLQDLLPFFLLSVGFALSVLGAGFKLSAKFFKVSGILVFSLAAVSWLLALHKIDSLVLGLQLGYFSRIVGAMSSFFALSSFILFDVSKRYESRPEWLALLILSVMGLSLLPASRDWISFFVFLEFFSIPSYILAGYDTNRERSLEASLKYMLSGAFASALLLMGIALIYLCSGTVTYVALQSYFPNHLLSALALALLLSGIFFKMTIVPFHFWAPDVYQGSPMGVAAFLAAGTKLSLFVSVSLAFSETGFSTRADLLEFALIAGTLSILVGSFLAFTQRSFRRMLAYSGTVNAGVLAPLMLMGKEGLISGVFFLSIYGLTLALILAALSSLLKKRHLDSNADIDPDELDLKDALHSKTQSLILALGLFSLAGIPPLPGFFAKYWVFSSLWTQGHVQLVVWALLGTLMGVAYYIRIAGKLFFAEKRSAII